MLCDSDQVSHDQGASEHPQKIYNQTLYTLYNQIQYRSETVNSKSFVGKLFLRIKWKFESNSAL